MAKKKATSKQPTRKKGKKKMAVFDKFKDDKPQNEEKVKPAAQPQTKKEDKKEGDPLLGFEERQAAAQEPTQKVARGDVKPPVAKPETFEEKKPEELTGPEQEAVMAAGGVLPKEQHDKEAKAQAVATGQPVPPAPTPTVGQSPMDAPPEGKEVAPGHHKQ